MMACVFMAACMGTRGTVGGKKVCTNSYLLGVLSISDLVSPCGKLIILLRKSALV